MLPDKLLNFRCYDEGNNMIGITDVTLPEITFMTDTLKGAGIAGEIDSPAMGHLQSMTATVNWRVLVDENAIYLSPKENQFDFRGSVQIFNELAGEYQTTAIKAVMKCIPKKMTLGNLDVAVTMGTSTELEVIYLKITLNNKETLEVDKINFIYKVNNFDYLAKVREDLGMA